MSARRAGFAFAEAWPLATAAVLAYMSDRRASEWWDILASTERAWADAYEDRQSPLAILPREAPLAAGVTVEMPGRGRRRRRQTLVG